jgi:non-heme chloroperoxidase
MRGSGVTGRGEVVADGGHDPGAQVGVEGGEELGDLFVQSGRDGGVLPGGVGAVASNMDLSAGQVRGCVAVFLIRAAAMRRVTTLQLGEQNGVVRHCRQLAVRGDHMGMVTTKDGVEIFYKDWGSGQPIVFSHGWPLSADDWDAQMMFFLQQGYRVIAHDRRGHGRSTQTADGHDMDHYADDLAAVVEHLDLHDAVHVGHSTGGGEVTRYLARHGQAGAAKAALISSVPPLMVKTEANPGGLPKEVFDGFQAQVATRRSDFYRELAAGPFYGFNRSAAKPSEAIIENWWRQGMMGGAKAHFDGIIAFSQTDFTEDLKKITIPVLVMHGDDDQIVPYPDSAPLSAKLLPNGTLKTYNGFPHGMPTTEAETINTDLLAFLRS